MFTTRGSVAAVGKVASQRKPPVWSTSLLPFYRLSSTGLRGPRLLLWLVTNTEFFKAQNPSLYSGSKKRQVIRFTTFQRSISLDFESTQTTCSVVAKIRKKARHGYRLDHRSVKVKDAEATG
ncbi:hypothetical protein J6590_092007 [Homalodisca vitripennis]|nr:hypothetical protein J6590_092007 [Homalodisca vitripennis]